MLYVQKNFLKDKMNDRTGILFSFLRTCLFKVISVGPIPEHIAFIMDGNRRYAKKSNSAVGAGHRAGYSSLMSMLVYCYELGVKYVTVYAFSIENFKRRPDEVKNLMDLMLEKIEGLLEQQSIVNQYGIRVHFIGNLKLLSEPVRVAAEKVMEATANNNKAFLLVCVAYTSCDEIVHAVEESCKVKRDEIQAFLQSNEPEDNIATRTCHSLVDDFGTRNKQRNLSSIKLVDIEKHMYMAVAPEPDIVIRSSGEARLSNFLLWQTANCPLYTTAALWPELGLWHLVWVVLNFQRSYGYFENKRKKV